MKRSQTRLQTAIDCHQRREWPKAEALCEEILRFEPCHRDAHLLLGTLYYEQKKIEQACQTLARGRQYHQEHLPTTIQLALALHEAGRHEEALDSYDHAIALDSSRAEIWFNRGNCLVEAGRHEEAFDSYSEAIRLRPSFVEAHHNRADLHRRAGRVDEAVEGFQSALRYQPEFIPSHINLAILLQQTGRPSIAIKHFEYLAQRGAVSLELLSPWALCLVDLGRTDEALELCRQAETTGRHDPTVLHASARVYLAQGRFAEAIERLQILDRIEHTSASAGILGDVYQLAGRFSDAIDILRRARNADPANSQVALSLAKALEQVDGVEEAGTLFQGVSLQLGNDPLGPLRGACSCPTVFEDESTIDQYRSQLSDAIERCHSQRPNRSLKELLAWGLMPPFNLQFHGRNERPLRQALGECVTSMLSLRVARRPRSARPIPRVGFLCTYNPQAFIRSIGGLLERINPSRLEIVLLATPASLTALRANLSIPSVRSLILPHSPRAMPEAIETEQLDLLFHFEASSTPLGYLLAAHRLAPVQVASWGIQTTTGLPAIDSYLTPGGIEGLSAIDHYTENIIEARTLLTWRSRLPTSPVAPSPLVDAYRGDHLYLVPQQLGKITPDMDAIFADILRRDPAGRVIITKGAVPGLADRLHERFRRHLPDVVSRIHFVPNPTGIEYHHLIRSAHVLLDPISFGGVNTTFDAFSLGKIALTLPGEFQRNRYTAGCYRRVGIDECIALSTEDYVRKALRFAAEEDYRIHWEREIANRADILFEDANGVRDLEEQLLRLLHESESA